MKLKNFNIEDVFCSNDAEQAKQYIGKKGYYADYIEQLDEFIENKKHNHIGTLYSIDTNKADTLEHFIISCDFDYHCPYNYFLPLDKVKKEYTCDFKTESVKKDQQYRPLRNKKELIEFICENTNSSQVIGTVICIKKKDESQVTVTTITAITDYFDPLSDKPIYEITLGTGKTYSFECLFGLFEIAFNYNQLWRPFGVLENE